MYNETSRRFDGKMLKKWNADLDILLISVSLTSRGWSSTLIRLTQRVGCLVLCNHHRLPHQGPR